MKLYSVSDEYIQYLRKKFPRVYSNKENLRVHTRKYLGVVIEIENHKYYIPLSSPKEKHDYILVNGEREIRKDSLIVIRIVSGGAENKELKGTLQIGTMIPVPDSAIELYDVDNEPDQAYKDLINEELIFIRKNEKTIIKNARVLYSKRKSGVENRVVQSCLDFIAIEKECDNWKKHLKILVLGGTRFFGVPMVEELLKAGHEVTIATRGRAVDSYGDRVNRILLERTSEESMKNALKGKHFDVVIDKIAYCSNDIRYAMESVNCDKYIYMSSTSVYEPKHWNTKESDFDANEKEFVWCDRMAFPYEEIKRQAECALWQEYRDRKWIAVRYPFAIGKDDYTKRLQFYVEHTMKSIPMYIDNLDCQMSFIRSDEAGKFLAFLADEEVTGAINGSAEGTISLREIIDYVERKTGAKAVITKNGDAAPYNGEPEYSINTDKAKALGFPFSKVQDWIYDLLDYYIKLVEL